MKNRIRTKGKVLLFVFFCHPLSRRKLRNGRLGPDEGSESCPWRRGTCCTPAMRRCRKIHGSLGQGRRDRDTEGEGQDRVGAERKGKSARASLTGHHSPSSLNHRHLSARRSEAGAPRSRQGRVGLFCALSPWIANARSSHVSVQCAHARVLISSSYKATGPDRAHLDHLIFAFVTSLATLLANIAQVSKSQGTSLGQTEQSASGKYGA